MGVLHDGEALLGVAAGDHGALQALLGRDAAAAVPPHVARPRHNPAPPLRLAPNPSLRLTTRRKLTASMLRCQKKRGDKLVLSRRK